jgi:hypothetical protein
MRGYQGCTIPIMPVSGPSVISTTGTDIEPDSSTDITVQEKCEEDAQRVTALAP